MSSHFAFLSYASRYEDWATVFHQHLEAALNQDGKERKVFYDKLDLSSGMAWQTALQKGVSDAEHLVLVATPETFASPWTESEWQSFAGENRDRWRAGHFHIVRLVDCPLPPFLNTLQAVDFREHDEAKYRQAFQELLAGLLGKSKRDPPDLPDLGDPPPCPDGGLPPELRGRIIAELTPLLRRSLYRKALATALGFDRNALDPYPSLECAASAALVRSTGSDAPAEAALRVVQTLIEEVEEDEPELVAELQRIAVELEALTKEQPEAGLLQRWLQKVVEDHNRLTPYFQQQEELTLLEAVYVPLALHLEERGPRTKEVVGSGGQWRLRDLLELDPEEHSWVTRRWVVKGHPGAGKTTLLRHLAASVAGETDQPWVPVLESLPRLMRDSPSGPAWLLERIERRMRRAGEKAAALTPVLERAGKDGRLLLLLDGLDEVQKESRDEAFDLLRDLSARWPATPIVVSSRPIGYRTFDTRFVEVELQELDRERRLHFLRRWFARGGKVAEADTARSDAALALLEGDASLWELSGNPLYLTLMALLLEQDQSPNQNRTELYDQVFDLLLQGDHRGLEAEAMEPEKAVRTVLRFLGFQMTADNKDSEPREVIADRFYSEGAEPFREELERIRQWHRDFPRFLDALAERTGILGPHDGPDADWRFWHRTFREALAAERLAALVETQGEQEILNHARGVGGDESRWAEPYALLTGRLEEPDGLVRSLFEANRTLGLRAVATAHELSEETLGEVLELTDDLKERPRVFARLPELVGDGERTLRLLDRLYKTRSGAEDLFFLDVALSDVATRWPEFQVLAESQRARLFDHIPEPDLDLFRWVETPKGGKVALWREIPAGSFFMGSPEDEEGRYDDEGPQHEVQIMQPFGMAAVPVTNRQYRAFDPDHRWESWEGISNDDLAHHPVVNVSWYAAMAFCLWLRSLGLEGARLPTEEEWEYACRAGTQTAYWSGDSEKDLARVGWYGENSEGRTHRVGEKAANELGLYDVHGNVDEWMVSGWSSNYSGREGGIEHDPRQEQDLSAADLAASSGEVRVIRGGGYGSTARLARSAFRVRNVPWGRSWNQGFRVVVPVAPSS